MEPLAGERAILQAEASVYAEFGLSLRSPGEERVGLIRDRILALRPGDAPRTPRAGPRSLEELKLVLPPLRAVKEYLPSEPSTTLAAGSLAAGASFQSSLSLDSPRGVVSERVVTPRGGASLHDSSGGCRGGVSVPLFDPLEDLEDFGRFEAPGFSTLGASVPSRWPSEPVGLTSD